MEHIKNKNNVVLSLGHNCYIKQFLNSEYRHTVTHFFDWVGSSAWFMNEYFLDDIDMFVRDDYEHGVTIYDKKSKRVTYNKKYYLRFPHDMGMNAKNFDEQYKKTTEKYNRRKERFIELMKDLGKKNKPIYFIRIEEETEKRVIPDQLKKYYDENEVYYLSKFMDKLKKEFNVIGKVILLSVHLPTKLHNNVLVLNHDYELEWLECHKQISDIINENKEIMDKLFWFIKNEKSTS